MPRREYHPPLRRPARLARAAAILAIPLLWVSAGADRGVLIEVDRAHYSLRALDLASGAVGPSFPVALGSPEHPTPRGAFPMRSVVRNPRFVPGPDARAAGARPHPPAPDGPLGIAKIPFAAGAIALHGGAHPFALRKPVSLGCVETRDADLLRLLRWLEARHALQPVRASNDGELHQRMRRPVHIVVR